MGMGDSKGNTGEGQFKTWTQCSWRVNCMEQKSDTAVVRTPPNVARTLAHTHTVNLKRHRHAQTFLLRNLFS